MNYSEVERYLKEYWYADKAVGRLVHDLDIARDKYNRNIDSTVISCGSVKTGTNNNTTSPTERAAILAERVYSDEIAEIERQLNTERGKKERIDKEISEAALTRREDEYVRMRYKENRSVRYISMILGKDERTCQRIRIEALGKIGEVIEANLRIGVGNIPHAGKAANKGS